MYSSTSPLELQQTATVIYPTLKTKAVTRTSIILIVCGVLSVILQVSKNINCFQTNSNADADSIQWAQLNHVFKISCMYRSLLCRSI